MPRPQASPAIAPRRSTQAEGAEPARYAGRTIWRPCVDLSKSVQGPRGALRGARKGAVGGQPLYGCGDDHCGIAGSGLRIAREMERACAMAWMRVSVAGGDGHRINCRSPVGSGRRGGAGRGARRRVVLVRVGMYAARDFRILKARRVCVHPVCVERLETTTTFDTVTRAAHRCSSPTRAALATFTFTAPNCHSFVAVRGVPLELDAPPPSALPL